MVRYGRFTLLPETPFVTTPNRSVISRDLILSLYLPALMLALGQGIIAPVLPVYAKSFNISFGEASLLFVVFQLGGLVATFPTGYFMDVVGRRPIVVAGPLITALSSLACVFATSYPELLVYRFIAGAAQELWNQARLAIIADSTVGSQRGRQVTWMVGVQRVGILLGPALGGVLATAFDIKAPFLVHGLLMFAIVLPSFFSVKETGNGRSQREAAARAPGAPPALTGAAFWRFLLSAQILTFFVIQFLGTVCRGAEGGTFQLYAVYAYDVGPGTLGLTSALAGVVAVPIPFATGYFMDRWGRKRVIVPAFALLAVTLVFVAVTAFVHWPFEMYVLGYAFAQMGQGTTNGTMQVLGSDMAPAEARGKFFGIWRSISAAGGLAAPWLFAQTAEKLNFGSAFLMLALSSAGVAALVGWMLKETVMSGETRADQSPTRA